MRWIGEGPDLFHVRVDLIVPDDDGRLVSPVAESLTARLPYSNGTDRALVGVDQGRGHERSPVLGLSFMVRASGFGPAAELAADTALAAAADLGLHGPIYDLVLVPEDALVLPEGERIIPRPD